MLDQKYNIDFKVPLSGSKLFDINATVTAKKLCDKFPGLEYEVEQTYVRIYGNLNEYWTEKFNAAVFTVGSLDI